jgi:hypothetical protein
MQTIHVIQAFERTPLLWAIAWGLAICLVAWRAHVRVKQSVRPRRAVAVIRRSTVRTVRRRR